MMTPESRTVRRVFWFAIYLAPIVAPLLVFLLARTPSGKGLGWDLGVGFGIAGLLMMGTQFLLTARFRRATAPFGIDIIYYFHRYVGYVIVIVIVLHLAILITSNPDLVKMINPFSGSGSWPMIAGAGSAVLLLFLVAISAFRKALGLPYKI